MLRSVNDPAPELLEKGHRLRAWEAFQAGINSCTECKRLGSGLMIHTTERPARPPAPSGGELLFISEAPPPSGGFWAAPPAEDDLRRNLFLILQGKNVPLPGANARNCLAAVRLSPGAEAV